MNNVKQDFLSCATTYAIAMEEVYEVENSPVDRKKHLKTANQMIVKLKKIYHQAYCKIFNKEILLIDVIIF